MGAMEIDHLVHPHPALKAGLIANMRAAQLWLLESLKLQGDSTASGQLF